MRLVQKLWEELENSRLKPPQPWRTKAPAIGSKRAYKLTIYSNRKAAEVFLKNKSVGRTPLPRDVTAGGSLKILVTHPGYNDWEKSLTMHDNEHVNVVMVPLSVKKAKSSSRTWLWIAGGVGAAALGATAFILISPDDGGTKTESLPPFKRPPEGK